MPSSAVNKTLTREQYEQNPRSEPRSPSGCRPGSLSYLVAGSEEYADWSEQLLSWEDVEAKLGDYLVEVGLAEPGDDAPYDAVTFRRQLEDKVTAAAASADAGYPDNEGLIIDPETGVPSLKAHRSEGQRASAKALEQEIKARMPERSLLGIISRTAYWVEWWRRFGPASGNEPKPKDPFGRYVITTFVKGTNMGPYEAARHIPGVPGHELSPAANRHFSIPTPNEAIADLVNAHARLDISPAWGDGSTVAADGTHMDTYLNNLLSETSVRYGKPGGIAYHHTSDTYIALFYPLHPVRGVGGRLHHRGPAENTSEVKPTTVHADTQGQSFPVFALAHLLGFDLMSRMRVAVSVREGAISSTLLLRQLQEEGYVIDPEDLARPRARGVRPASGRRLQPAAR